MTISHNDNESADEVLARFCDLLMMAGGNGAIVLAPDTAPLKRSSGRKIKRFDNSLLGWM